MSRLSGFRLKKTKDFAINILASVVLTFMTQLVVYPSLGRWLSAAEYGSMLTLIGVINAVGSSFGGALNNARILMDSEYTSEGISGDSNIFAVFSGCICFLLTFTLGGVIQKGVSLNLILIGIVSTLVFFRAFYSAAFRIHINFKKTLVSNLCGVLGYGIGIVLVYCGGHWAIAFLCGELFSCIYVAFNSFILKEPFVVTKKVKQYASRFGFYFISNGLGCMVIYMDRLFLFPLLGAVAVSTYSTASLFGKMAGIIITPITGVLLSYYCKEGEITLKQLGKRFLMFSVISAFAYCGISILGYPILTLLYPTLALAAKPYFYIANLGTIIMLLGDSIMPTILRYAKPKWSTIIQSVFVASYLLAGFIGMKQNALYGYCLAVVSVNALRLIIMIIISIVTVKKQVHTFSQMM